MQEKPPLPPIWALVLVTAMSPLALNIFLPSMPSIARDFGVAPGAVQPALSLYFLGVAVGQLIYGPISDRYGRRPVLIFGVVVFALTNFHLVFADSVASLILGRTAQAFGGCAGMVLTRAIVRDVYDRDRSASAMGYITTAMVVAPALAPAAGAMLDVRFGWRASFVALTVYAAVVLPVLIARVRETNLNPLPAISFAAIRRGYGALLRSAVFNAYFITIAFGSAAFFAFLSGAPHAVVEVLGGTPLDYGRYFAAVALAYMAGNFTAGRYALRLGLPRMLAIGLCLMIAGSWAVLALLVGAPSFIGLFGPVALASYGSGLVYPAATAGAVSVQPQIAGTASGLLGFAPLALGAAFSELIGATLDQGLWPFLAVYAGASTVAAVAGLAALALDRAPH